MLYTIVAWDEYLFESVAYTNLTKEGVFYTWNRLEKLKNISDLRLSLQIDTSNKSIEEVLN